MPTSPDGIASSTTTPTNVRVASPPIPVVGPFLNGTSRGTGGSRSAAIAAAPNSDRIKAWIQNLATANPLFVKLGPGATTTDYHRVLKVAGGATDGTGGDWLIEGYNGEISVASAGTVAYDFVETTR